ncbi:Protein of unknown function, partial [Gryllus bimaculatus]
NWNGPKGVRRRSPAPAANSRRSRPAPPRRNSPVGCGGDRSLTVRPPLGESGRAYKAAPICRGRIHRTHGSSHTENHHDKHTTTTTTEHPSTDKHHASHHSSSHVVEHPEPTTSHSVTVHKKPHSDHHATVQHDDKHTTEHPTHATEHHTSSH